MSRCLRLGLHHEFGAGLNRFQLADQLDTVEQQRSSCPVTAEEMHQLDRPAAPDPEEPLKHRPVDDRHFHAGQLLLNLRKS